MIIEEWVIVAQKVLWVLMTSISATFMSAEIITHLRYCHQPKSPLLLIRYYYREKNMILIVN
jgi:hypothetical protein